MFFFSVGMCTCTIEVIKSHITEYVLCTYMYSTDQVQGTCTCTCTVRTLCIWQTHVPTSVNVFASPVYIRRCTCTQHIYVYLPQCISGFASSCKGCKIDTLHLVSDQYCRVGLFHDMVRIQTSCDVVHTTCIYMYIHVCPFL